MRSICAMCLVPCAMCQSSYAKDQVCILMDSFMDIMFLSFVSILCVQVSLWMHIFMIICHLRNLYTWESAYSFLISFIPRRSLGLSLFDSLVDPVRGWKVSASMYCVYLCTLEFVDIWDPCLPWWAFYFLSSPWVATSFGLKFAYYWAWEPIC
jgi:hypothetical protein